jgi:indolepyruvate ferredoxin oxidoreductase alpha subunit
MIRRFVDHCDQVTVVEESYPFIESRLSGVLGLPNMKLRGKMDGTFPWDGELLPEIVARALGIDWPTPTFADPLAAARPPQFCKGCPHAFTFNALVDATTGYDHALLFSDIGCYALGIMPPYRAVHSCVDMGSSIGLAHGASRAGANPVLCTIGDSTFAHSGLQALLGAVHSDANITVMILDNATTAMTGAQESMATGEPLVEMLRGLGVKDLHVFEPIPKNHGANVEIIRRAIEHKGLSVLVARRACIHLRTPRPAQTQIPICQAQEN